MTTDLDPAVEVVRSGEPRSILLTCEHASERLPEPFSWPPEDAWLRGTHWAYDLGAAALTRELAESLRTVAVLSRFSRLLADANRPETAPDLFRAAAEGRPIALNRSIADAEREERLAYFRAFHAAVDREVALAAAPILLAVHTFTPVYEGRPRTLEAGVLFDEEEALAESLRLAIASAGFRVRMNEPYSGKDGLMYSVDRHAQRHGRRPIEIEFRQDLAETPEERARLVRAVTGWLSGPRL